MTTSPEQIETEIAQTREEIKNDVDALTDKLDPRKAAGRQASKVKETVTGAAVQAKETLIGTSSDIASQGSSTVSGAAGAVREAPSRLASRTSGNPWAMGLGAFALGWLASSLIPTTSRERQAVHTLRDSDVVQPLASTAREVASQASEHVKEAASTVAEQAKEAATTVAGQAKDAGSTVGAHARESSPSTV
jgi:ElaB/YqjD/DUF883 family membrane-anchored ribosome-binding protein